jgi:hypothetical protein
MCVQGLKRIKQLLFLLSGSTVLERTLAASHGKFLKSLWDFKFSRRRVWSSSSLIMEAVRTSETSVDNYFTRQYIPEENSEFLDLIYTFGRTPLGEWSTRRKGLYLHRTKQHKNTRTNIHALSGIRTHDLSAQKMKAYASDRAATGTSYKMTYDVSTVLVLQVFLN